MAKKLNTAPPMVASICNTFGGGEDKVHLDPTTPYDLEDPDVFAATQKAAEAYAAWAEGQRCLKGAEARVAYAETAARYLVGIFPNARVSADAYAYAAGEELGRFSADVTKLVCQRARRTLKTLPAIAQLLEWARDEERCRKYEWNHYSAALAAHAAAIAKGRREAEQIARRAAEAGIGSELDADAVLRLHWFITFHPMGVQAPGRLAHTWRVAAALNASLAEGNAAAADWARRLLECDGRHRAIPDHELRGDHTMDADREREALLRPIADALGLPWPADEFV